MVLWLLLVLIVSIVPVPETEIETGDLDKTVHFIIYGITGVLILRLLSDKGLTTVLIISLSIVTASLYGLFLEIIQSFLPYRSFSIDDIMANCSGATIFVIFSSVYKKGLLKGKG